MFGTNDGQKGQDNPIHAPSPFDNASPQPTSPPDSTSVGGNAADDLLDIKQQALQNLTPKLIKEAYNAANQIPDEKSRAQALIDIINEINYFTHKNG
jgi:hypothetical protein